MTLQVWGQCLTLAGVLALGAGCSDHRADPVRAAQAFTTAALAGNMAAVLPLLESTARERLSQAADQASDQVGGRRQIAASEMLQIVDLPRTFQLAQTTLVDSDGSTARVRLVGAQREEFTLTLVHEDDAWFVRIPMPP